jgi:hypothetical protein
MAIISLNGINQLIFVMVKRGVLFEVRTEFLSIVKMSFVFKGLTFSNVALFQQTVFVFHTILGINSDSVAFPNTLTTLKHRAAEQLNVYSYGIKQCIQRAVDKMRVRSIFGRKTNYSPPSSAEVVNE